MLTFGLRGLLGIVQKIWSFPCLFVTLQSFLMKKIKDIAGSLCFVCLWGAIMVSCSTTKFVPDGQYLLKKTVILSDDPKYNPDALKQYVKQKPNAKWFSLLNIPLGTYSLAGCDSTKWINRVLKKFGQPPVLYDSALAHRSCDDLTMAMKNEGFMQAYVEHHTTRKGKKLTQFFMVHPGHQYYLGQVNYNIQDSAIQAFLAKQESSSWTLKPGLKFTVSGLDAERKRITALLNDNGYYRFHKDFIQFKADTVRNGYFVDLTMTLLPYRESNRAPEKPHPQYTIRKINYGSGTDDILRLRPSVLANNTIVEEGKPYSASDLQRTYNNFSRLQAVKYTNIRFEETEDTLQLDCNIQLSTNKPSTISFSPEGTNTAGDLGAAAALTYENRNLFHGSELFSIQVRGAFEAIRGLEGYSNSNYIEYGAESKLRFPRFMAPFLSKHFLRNNNASSELSVTYNLQNRPEFHRRVFSTAWRYRWSQINRNVSYKLDLIDLNYIYMPWISSTFKTDYLDDSSNRNAILRYNYEDLFIMRIGFGVSYAIGSHAIRANIETAGNILNLAAQSFDFKKNNDGQYKLFNIAFAQYVKADVDYTKAIRFDENNTLVFHAGLGIAYPYGNSNILPFEKRYFSGGANSVRGWSVRRLGPGKFKGTDGKIDFINQTGDMRLDLNMEYRTKLLWKLGAALFIDAGNIWTLRNYPDQPGGQFRFNDFYKEIAVAYGLGLRLNFDYFILRFDLGMKAINPVYDDEKEHFPIIHPKLSRDAAFHFAVGLPF